MQGIALGVLIVVVGAILAFAESGVLGAVGYLMMFAGVIAVVLFALVWPDARLFGRQDGDIDWRS